MFVKSLSVVQNRRQIVMGNLVWLAVLQGEISNARVGRESLQTLEDDALGRIGDAQCADVLDLSNATK
jgi:hypothetical protein